MTAFTLSAPFDTRMFLLSSGSPVTAAFGSGDSVIFGLANGYELEFKGTGLTRNGFVPTGGTVTEIQAYFVENAVSTPVASMATLSTPAWTFTMDGLRAGPNLSNIHTIGFKGANYILGGSGKDFYAAKGGNDEVHLGGGDDVMLVVATTPAVPAVAFTYDGGAGRDWLAFGARETVDLRQATLVSVEGLEVDYGTMVFSSSQLTSTTGLANITHVSAGATAIVRIIQNTAVADMGRLPGALYPQWVLVGRSVADQQYGSNTLALTMQGNGGNDILRGRGAGETLNGGSGNDQLSGGGGRDTVLGGTGGDTLTGGTGNDVLTGGSSHDRFVFAKGCGQDTVTDFHAYGTAWDRIDLRGVTSVTGITDLRRNHLVVSGDDLVLQLGNGDRILLKDVVRADLDASDFIFAG